MMVAEYLTGTPADLRGYPYTNRAGCQFLHVNLTPNSSAPDNMYDHPSICFPEMHYPEANLPVVCGAVVGNNAGARSRHPGGVHGLLCDGSVQFLSDSIDLTLWRRLGWMADGNPISPF